MRQIGVTEGNTSCGDDVVDLMNNDEQLPPEKPTG